MGFWTSEVGYPYWRPGVELRVTLNAQKSLDDDGLTKMFDVMSE